MEQRDRKQRELEQSFDPSVGIARTVARARRRGLRVSAPTGEGLSQPLPFESSEPAREIVFSDPLPAYIDWRTFRYLNGLGRGFANWLAKLVPPNADVVPAAARDQGENDWHSFGCAPLIAERARPMLPRQRVLLRQELATRMPPLLPRQPGHHAPLEGKPRWEMNSAFALDIYGMDQVGIAQANELHDYFLRDKKTGAAVSIDDDNGSRGGRRYVREGRCRLARLGAWPWCLTDNGRLPRQWYNQQDYAEALACWHYQQSLTALAVTCGSIAAVARHPPTPLSKESVRERARATYRDLYERTERGQEPLQAISAAE